MSNQWRCLECGTWCDLADEKFSNVMWQCRCGFLWSLGQDGGGILWMDEKSGFPAQAPKGCMLVSKGEE